MAPYQEAGFELKFLGTMNGSSLKHTNAYFYPEKDVIAFVDLSYLNYEKASFLITSNLKRVILFLTHLHDDHATGVLSLAFLVRDRCPGVILEVVTGNYILHDAFSVFYATGGRPIIKDGKLSEVLRIYGQRFDGKILTRVSPESELLVEQDFLLNNEQKFEIPSWFVKTVPTVHSPRLSGAVGFVFLLNDKAVIYSGDTNTADPFFEKAENYALEVSDHVPTPTELYLEAQDEVETSMHLSFQKIRKQLMLLMKRAPVLRAVLMHYNDHAITYHVRKFNEELGEERLFVAEPEEYDKPEEF